MQPQGKQNDRLILGNYAKLLSEIVGSKHCRTSLAVIPLYINGNFTKYSGRAKEGARLLAEKLPFAELRDGIFRRHHQRPALAVTGQPILIIANGCLCQ